MNLNLGISAHTATKNMKMSSMTVSSDTSVPTLLAVTSHDDDLTIHLAHLAK